MFSNGTLPLVVGEEAGTEAEAAGGPVSRKESPDSQGIDLGIKPPPGKPYRATCSETFRQKVLDRYGALRDDERYRRFFMILAFPSHTDDVDGLPVICADTIAWAAGKRKQSAGGNYRTEAFLEEFREAVLERFVWSTHVPGKRCRIARVRGFDDEVLRWIEDEISQPVTDAEARVDFVSGKRYSPARQQEARERERVRALKRLGDAGCDEAREIMAYMNDLKPNVFSKLLRVNEREAYRVANGLPINERRAALATLHRIADQPVPFYTPSRAGRTVRLFDQGSIATLKKEVRHALMAGCTDFDLVSSQLAVVASLWDVRVVRDSLREWDRAGRAVWDEFYDYLGIAPNVQAFAKGTLKTALYALCFGASDPFLKGVLTLGLTNGPVESRRDAYAFLDHPVIRALREARDRQIKRIISEGGARDVYGRWRPVEGKKTIEEGARSVLAQLAQATELHLVFPALELARTTRDFQIILWQHDGFTVRFSDRTKQERWTERIVRAVQKKAEDLGVPTRLEYKLLKKRGLSSGKEPLGMAA